MFTRALGDGGWAAGCAGAPPPLHIYDTQSEAANWHPLERPEIMLTPPGPVLIQIPQPGGAELGDDPLDPTAQTRPRFRCTGMISYLDVPGGLR